MRKISLWAKGHVWPARIMLVLCILILNALGIMAGILLNDSGINLPAFFFYIIVPVYLLALLLYPSKKKREPGHRYSFYKKQKGLDVVLLASAFCLFVYTSNNNIRLGNYFPALHATTIMPGKLPSDSTVRSYKPIASFYRSMKDESGNLLKWKERKKLLKEQIKSLKHSDEMSQGAKVALIILSVLVAIGLLFLIAGLACNLSCSGSDAAAVIIGIGGTGLVIFLLVVAIRAILGKKRKKIKNKDN